LDFLPVVICDYLLGVLVMLFLNTLSHQKNGTSHLGRLHHGFAGFSYSLYLCHWPFALFLAVISQHYLGIGMQMPFGIYSVFHYVVVLGVTYVFSWLVSHYTERHTPALRRHLASWLGVKPPGGGAIPQRAVP
jgi:peptidoglycan/LPS O-acetylase OafA/YrhL